LVVFLVMISVGMYIVMNIMIRAMMLIPGSSMGVYVFICVLMYIIFDDEGCTRGAVCCEDAFKF